MNHPEANQRSVLRSRDLSGPIRGQNYLGVEARVREAEDEGGEHGEVLVGGDVGRVGGRRLPEVGVEGEVEEHQEVAEHADDEARDDDRVATLPRSRRHKPEQSPARHLTHRDEN